MNRLNPPDPGSPIVALSCLGVILLGLVGWVVFRTQPHWVFALFLAGVGVFIFWDVGALTKWVDCGENTGWVTPPPHVPIVPSKRTPPQKRQVEWTRRYVQRSVEARWSNLRFLGWLVTGSSVVYLVGVLLEHRPLKVEDGGMFLAIPLGGIFIYQANRRGR